MSPKSRGRKRKPGSRPAHRPASPRWPVRPGAARPGDLTELQAAARRLADDVYRRCEPFRQLTADDADPFEAELQGAVLLNDLIEAWSELDAAMGMTTVAARHPEPHVAAAVAAVQHLSPGMAHAMALQDLKARGLAPPAWADRLGHVTPRRAWHYEDTFGEQEIFLASFAYDERAGADGEHAVLVEVARSPNPRLQRAHPSRTIDELLHRLEALRGCDGRPLQETPLGWVQMRARLAEALARPHRDCTTETLVWSRLVRTRLRVLPEPGPAGDSALEAPRPTATDRAAAVRSFLARAGTYQTGTDVAGTEPLAEVCPEVLAFWARVMVACTGAHASSPTRIGPIWLGHVLGEYVPRTFEVSAVQRAGLGPAVTAWARWAAREQGFDDVAVARLVERVTEIDASFDTSYDEPAVVALRAYVSDVAADDRDGAELEQVRARRHHAVPLPGRRTPPSRHLQLSDPEQRHRILAEHLKDWALSDTDTSTEWLAALQSVSDQLWDADPPQLADAARDYMATGLDETLLGDLTEIAVECGDDRAAFLRAASERLTIDNEPWEE